MAIEQLSMVNAADLRCAPVLTRTAEAVRHKIEVYVVAMVERKREVQAITLFAGDYDAVLRAVNRKRGKVPKDEAKPDACSALTWGGVPIKRGCALDPRHGHALGGHADAS